MQANPSQGLTGLAVVRASEGVGRAWAGHLETEFWVISGPHWRPWGSHRSSLDFSVLTYKKSAPLSLTFRECSLNK